MNIYVTGLDSSVRHLTYEPETPHTIPTVTSSPKKGVSSGHHKAPRSAEQGQDASGLHYERKKKQVIDPDTGSVVGIGYASGNSYATSSGLHERI